MKIQFGHTRALSPAIPKMSFHLYLKQNGRRKQEASLCADTWKQTSTHYSLISKLRDNWRKILLLHSGRNNNHEALCCHPVDFRESKCTKQEQTKEMRSDKHAFLFLLLLLVAVVYSTEHWVNATLTMQISPRAHCGTVNMKQLHKSCESK